MSQGQQQYVAEIHMKTGVVYYYITGDIARIAGTANWFTSETDEGLNYVGVYTDLDHAFNVNTHQVQVVARRKDMSHIVYRNAFVEQLEDGTHVATPEF